MDKTRQCNSYKTDFLDNKCNVQLSVNSIDNLAAFPMLENKTNLVDIISILEQSFHLLIPKSFMKLIILTADHCI